MRGLVEWEGDEPSGRGDWKLREEVGEGGVEAGQIAVSKGL